MIDGLASDLEKLFEKHLAAKDARIAEMEAKLAAIRKLVGDDAAPLVNRDPHPETNPEPAIQESTAQTLQGPSPEPRTTDAADLINLSGNEAAAAILKSWVAGNTRAPHDLREFLESIEANDEALVVAQRDNSGNPNMVACQALVREAIFYMHPQNGKPQQVRDRLVRLFGDF